MIVADSSVWIGYLRGDQQPSSLLLRHLIARQAPLAMLPAILQEVLQGARDNAQFMRYTGLFASLQHAQVEDPFQTATIAASIYRRCIAAGYTIRSPIDCLIAASCIELQMPLLHRDRDFEFIAAVQPELKRVKI